MIDLQPPADQVARIAAAIDDAQLGDPTPCEESSVGDLLAHVLGLSVAFRDAAGKVVGPTTSTPPTSALPPLDPEWRDKIPRALDDLVAAWRAPAAWQGETTAGGVTMPAEMVAAVASNELLLHGWDLARATGQPFAAAEENLEASYAFCSQTPDNAEARNGLFGPVVHLEEEAPLLDRTLGFAGRDPGWQPPS